MITKSQNALKSCWLLCCFVLLSFAAFSQTPHITVTMTNCSATANTLSYDLMVVNDGTAALKMSQIQTGVLYPSNLMNGGVGTYTYVTGTSDIMQPALGGTPGGPGVLLGFPTVTNNVAKLNLRQIQLPIGSKAGAMDLPFGVSYRIGRFTLTNTVNWATGPANLTLALATIIGGTNMQSACYVGSNVASTALVSPAYPTPGTVGYGGVCALQLCCAPISSSTYVSICSSALPYSWNGTTITSAGTYNNTTPLTNSCGSDSTATVVLTVNSPSSSSTDVTICSNELPYSWNGTTITSAGTYANTTPLTNAAGCDSTATVVLTVNSTSSSSTNVTICEVDLPYSWNGTTITSAGTYANTTPLTNAAGCDSTATVVLTVNAASSSTTNVTTCTLPYNWNGNDYGAAGSYTIHIPNAAGCDSAATLVLTLSPFAVDTITGPTGACAYASVNPATQTTNLATYSVAATSATSYSWSVINKLPATALISFKNGTTNPTLVLAYGSTLTSATIQVVVSSSTCGGSFTRTLNVTKGLPVLGNIVGLANVCPNVGTNVPLTYSIAPVANALSYRWTLPTAGISNVVRAADSLSVSFTLDANFASFAAAQRTIKVKAISGCGNTADKSLILAPVVPAAPATLVGVTAACPYMTTESATFRCRKVANAISYDWTFPVGTINVTHPNGLGADDTVVTVQFDSLTFVGGQLGIDVVTARGVSSCGAGVVKASAVIKRAAPANAGVFLANPANPVDPTKPITDICLQLAGGSSNVAGTPIEYKIRKVVGATSYIWDVYSIVNAIRQTDGISYTHQNAPGVNDTAIIITFTNDVARTNTTISVKAANPCAPTGTGEKKLLVKPTMSATPGTITGAVNSCTSVANGTSERYTIRSVKLATSYEWDVQIGGVHTSLATITHPNGSGINDTVIDVTYDPAYLGGSVTVKSIRNCGISVAKTLAVSTKKIGFVGSLTGNQAPCVGAQAVYTCTTVPNASGYHWEVPINATIISHSGAVDGPLDTMITVQYPTTALLFKTGSVSVTANSLCGTAGAKKLAIAKGTTGCRPAAARGIASTESETATKLDVSIYPNPSRGNFNIAINSSDKVSAATMDITNEYGQSVYKRSANNNNGVVELKVNNNLANGIYMVTVTVGAERITKRLVINR